jgi:hypothetical protein
LLTVGRHIESLDPAGSDRATSRPDRDPRVARRYGPGGGQVVAGAPGHQGVIKIRDSAEDLEEHPAHRGGGVNPLVDHHQVDPPGLQVIGEGDPRLEGPSEPVERGDPQLVAF